MVIRKTSVSTLLLVALLTVGRLSPSTAQTTTAASTTAASTASTTTTATSTSTASTSTSTSTTSAPTTTTAVTSSTARKSTTPVCLLKCQNGGYCNSDPVTQEQSCVCPGNWAGGLCEAYPTQWRTFGIPCANDGECSGLNEFCTSMPAGYRYQWPTFQPYVPTTTQAPTCICPNATVSYTVTTTVTPSTTTVMTTMTTTTAGTTTASTTTTTTAPTTTASLTTTMPYQTTTACICVYNDTTTAQTTTAAQTTTTSKPSSTVSRKIIGTCYCRPGYYYSTALAGCVPNDPCAIGETCRQIEGGWCEYKDTYLNCTCPAWMTDVYCNSTVPIWGNWTDWSACTVTCGTCVQVRTRPCIDHRGIVTKDSVCNNYFRTVRGHFELKPVNMTVMCLAADNPCSRDPCNSNVYGRAPLHTCIQSPISIGGFLCNCAPGYINRGESPFCFEDNKCLTTNDCQTPIAGSLAMRTCVNQGFGNYTCSCPAGFKRDPADMTYRKCIDIDECAIGTHNCDASDRATCTNTLGSFMCACNLNLYGDGTKGNCTFDIFSALNSSGLGYTYIAPNPQNLEAMTTPCISSTFPIPLYGGNYGSRFYATWNGLIVMTNYSEEEVCNQFTLKSPPATSWDKLKLPKRVVGVVAPYWTSHGSWNDSGTNSTKWPRGIYYQVMQNKTMILTGIFADAATVTPYFQMLVIWHRMPYVANPSLEVTYYGWVSSDFTNTWAGAGFGDKLMKWNIISPTTANYPARVGVFLSSTVNVEWSNSWASSSNAAMVSALQSPDSVLDVLSSSYGKAIQWTIADETSKTTSPYRPCAEWALEAFTEPRFSMMKKLATYCPPTKAMTLGMYRFNQTYSNSWMACYKWREGTAVDDDSISAGCCYDSYTGTLLLPQLTLTFGVPGHAQRGNAGKKTLLTDSYAMSICCLPYRAPVCNYFSQTVGSSLSYKTPAIATAYGGGHIVTFDGASYVTHNLGEFTLADIYDPRYGVTPLRARLQGRLSLASSIANIWPSEAASKWNWTAWTSFAVKLYNPDSVVVEVRLNRNTTWGYDILIDGVAHTVPCWETSTTSTTTAASTVSVSTATSSTTSAATTTAASTTTGTSTTTASSTSTASTSTTTTGSTTTTNPNSPPTCAGEPSSYPCQITTDRFVVNFDRDRVIIGMNNGGVIKIRVRPYFLSAIFFTASDWNDNTTGQAPIYKGLFGNRNGNANDEMQTNFGVGVDTSASSVSTVARSWLVNSASTLFTYSTAYPYKTARLAWLAHQPNITKISTDAINAASPNVTTALVAAQCFNDDSCAMDAGLFADISAGRNSAEDYVCFTSSRTTSLAYPIVPQNQTSGVVLKMKLNQAFMTNINLTSPSGLTFTISTVNVPAGFMVVGTQFSAPNITSLVVNETSSFIMAATDSNGLASLFLPSVQMCNCYNNGTCVWDTGYTMYANVPCQCPAGSAFTGQRCDEDIDPCTLSPCASGYCTRNDTYRNLYSCKPCPAPYIGDGTRCYLEDPCSNGKALCTGLATCRNAYPTYACDCPTGYAALSSGSCQDIDECLTGTAKCSGNTICVNTPGSFNCTCSAGYRQSELTGNCVDINECLETSAGPCASMNNSICINSVGSYSCQCAFGYTASSDKSTCNPINACTSPTVSCEGICTSGNGTYTCSCRPGFTLTQMTMCTVTTACSSAQLSACGSSQQSVCYVNADGTSGCTCRGRYEFSGTDCTDVDECSKGTHMCDLSISTCSNTLGGYKCTCNTGYTAAPDGISCIDTNECLTANGGCDATLSTCVNTPGSFYCSCIAGYALAQGSDGKMTCTDVNECQIKTAKCADIATCTNTAGSYKCTCPAGYTGPGQYCSDINECSSSSICPSKSTCTNTPGSYFCSCQQGTVNVSNVCTDVDWCSFSSILCPSGATCSNVVGGTYTCTCPTGYTYDGFNCVGPSSCTKTTCTDPVGQVCVVNPTTLVEGCICRTGFTAVGQGCSNVNECTATNAAAKTFASFACQNGAICNDLVGSYNCSCPDGYALSGPGVCTNINECLDSSTCATGSVCTDLPPPQKFSCACPTGYTLQRASTSPVGDKCVPVDACAAGLAGCAATSLGGVCTSGNGTYKCSCGAGWTGDGFSCYDVNECAAAKSPCPQGCTNTVGSYTCFCYSGYVMDGFGVCQDVNECQLLKSNCDQTCNNVPGSFTCSCQDGFNLESDGHTCKALQSCPANNGCSQLCAVVGGASKCFCKNTYAYSLDTDGKTCKQTDFCANKPCIGDATCANVAGGFSCTCTNGYKLSADGLKCVDRDGGWSDWSAWSTCSKSCGGGSQYQNRTCTNPSPLGAGLPCTGITAQSQACNPDRCAFTETENTYAVDLTWLLSNNKINFVTAMDSIGDQLRQIISDAVNSQCQKTPSQCCGGSASDSAYDATKLKVAAFTKSGYVALGNFFQKDVTFKFSTAVAADKQNSVCSLTTVQARRKREFFTYNTSTQMALPQSVLASVMKDVTLQQSITNFVNTLYGVTITWSDVGSPVTTTQAAVTSGLVQTTQAAASSSGGVATWVIAVAVVGAVIVIAVIIIVVIIVIKKRPPKVADGGESATKSSKSPPKKDDPKGNAKKDDPKNNANKKEPPKKEPPKKDDPKNAPKKEDPKKEPPKKEPPKKEDPKKPDNKKPDPKNTKNSKDPEHEVVDEIELKKTSTTKK